ncbi:MAG: NADP-dependent oxidoreductase [Deltaproteobacteria bacterium]|nr:NADP-dependent oxidoreductase [Deltaproteobacteria bacterium]
MKSREIRLRSRPRGTPTPDDFELAEVDVPEPGDGEIVVKNRVMSVDPYMRGRMNDVKSYVPPFALGKAMEGGAVGEVVASRAASAPVGTLVMSMFGWREAFVAPATSVQVVPPSKTPSVYLGVLGLTGLTAWVGLELVGVKAGDRVFISAAAGAVGSIAGQLAKHRGCRVVGSAGGAAKVALLTGELGFDAAFDYKAGDVAGQLAAAAPDGIDVYFDNVGGDHLEAAMGAMRPFGRISACGMISRYNDQRPEPGPSNMAMIVGKRLTIKGFIVSDSMARLPEMHAEVAPLLAQGKLHARETVIEGIARAPEAFLSLLAGGNVGKMVVAL